MNIRFLPGWVVVLAGLAILPVFGQPQKYDVQSRLVQVPVLVTDAKGNSLDGLEASDFQLFDNGQPQKFVVDSLGSGLAPISLVIAVQSSGISAPVLEKVRKIGAMIQPLIIGERGCAAVVTFSERVEWLQECTNSNDAIDGAINRLKPAEPRAGRMLDAVAQAVDRLNARPNSRHVLLLISESKDRGSETSLEAVARMCESSAVSVYAFTYSAFVTGFTTKSNPITRFPIGLRRTTPGRNEPTSPPIQARQPVSTPPEQRVDVLAAGEELARLDKSNTAQVLTTLTGGLVMPFTRQSALEEVVQKLGSELQTQYVLSFTPEDRTVGYHRIELKLKREGEFVLRARPGYWAGAGQ
ncbi:VWA domain-containing protein [Paludibaculum fermentans]|uniref:VWA domain-containing protein n=1 Tax=Paludibaculum fermentans TaxID=1473598 RepID=UPI003EBDD0BB